MTYEYRMNALAFGGVVVGALGAIFAIVGSVLFGGFSFGFGGSAVFLAGVLMYRKYRYSP